MKRRGGWGEKGPGRKERGQLSSVFEELFVSPDRIAAGGEELNRETLCPLCLLLGSASGTVGSRGEWVKGNFEQPSSRMKLAQLWSSGPNQDPTSWEPDSSSQFFCCTALKFW